MHYKTDSIEGVKAATMETLASVCSKYAKGYCFPSQRTILRLLKQYHGINICLRTLNYVLRWLEDHRYFKRTKRHRAGCNGQMIFDTTMYELKKKVYMRLDSMVKWANRVSSPLRVQVRAAYRSIERNEIFKQVAPNVDNLWKSTLEGAAPPV